MNFKFSKNQILILVLLLSLVLLLPFILQLAKQRQEIRKKAAGTGIVKLTLSPSNVEKRPGDTFTVSVQMTSTQAVQIGAADVKLQFDPNFFDVAVPTCGSTLSSPSGNAVNNNNIYIGCFVPGGQSLTLQPNTPVTLGSFPITVKDQSGQTQITFALTAVGEYPNGNDVSDAGTTATYTISTSATPTPTTTPTGTVTPSPTPSPTPTDGAMLPCVSFETIRINNCTRDKWEQIPRHSDCYAGDPAVAVYVNNPGATQMRFAVSPSTSISCSELDESYWVNWENYSPVSVWAAWRDSPGLGDKKLCSQFKDVARLSPKCEAAITIVAATPTPTPTGPVKIRFRVKFSGINEKKPDQQVRVSVLSPPDVWEMQGDSRNNVPVISNDNGVYQSDWIPFPNLPPGRYHILIKGPKHLQTRFCGDRQSRPCLRGLFAIYLNRGENDLDFSNYPLPGGDLPLPQDGVVNAMDAVALTNCFETPTSQTCLNKADLNLDGNISVADQIIMNNTIYTRWEDE